MNVWSQKPELGRERLGLKDKITNERVVKQGPADGFMGREERTDKPIEEGK